MILSAMKEKEETKVLVYRALKAAILNFKTAKNAKPYTEEEEIKIIKKEIKQREDAILQYSQAGRDDLVQNERVEKEVLTELLPKPADELDMCSTLFVWAYENKFYNEDKTKIAIPKKNMGMAIKFLQKEYVTNESSSIVNLVKKYLV